MYLFCPFFGGEGFLVMAIYTVKPENKGRSREPGNVAFMSSCPLYTG
jgi:hypothetical protein